MTGVEAMIRALTPAGIDTALLSQDLVEPEPYPREHSAARPAAATASPSYKRRIASAIDAARTPHLKATGGRVAIAS